MFGNEGAVARVKRWSAETRENEAVDHTAPQLVYTDMQDDGQRIVSVDVDSIARGLSRNKDLKFEFPDPVTCLCCLYFEVDLSKLLSLDKTFRDIKNRPVSINNTIVSDTQQSGHFPDNYVKASNTKRLKYFGGGRKKARSEEPSRIGSAQSSLPIVFDLKGAGLLKKTQDVGQHAINPKGFKKYSQDEIIEQSNQSVSSKPIWSILDTQLGYLKGRLATSGKLRSSSTNDSRRAPTSPIVRHFYKPETKSREDYERIITEQSYDIRNETYETPDTENSFTSTKKKVRFQDDEKDRINFDRSLPLIKNSGIPMALQRPLVTELTRDIAKRKWTGFFMKRSANEANLSTKYRTFL